jgi:dipeptidase E
VAPTTTTNPISLPHFGETRDERIKDLHEENDTPVIGLWEGGVLHVEADAILLLGAPARLFCMGRDPQDVQPGDDLARMLPLSPSPPGRSPSSQS